MDRKGLIVLEDGDVVLDGAPSSGTTRLICFWALDRADYPPGGRKLSPVDQVTTYEDDPRAVNVKLIARV